MKVRESVKLEAEMLQKTFGSLALKAAEEIARYADNSDLFWDDVEEYLKFLNQEQ